MASDLQVRLQAALGDEYRLDRELGGGGMSRVFLAEELALGRKVVLKVLPPELAAVVSVDRFRREILLTASLQHPHVVPLLAAGSAGGLLYYTMPLVEGESLRARLAREGELPISDAIRLLRDVADALACAHEHGVLHRDIKPDNILVSRNHALVADFGVAKALSAASGEGFSTVEGMALGTPAYMAPEQAAADPHTDRRADLYALGVVGYEMLTGTTPFPGLSGQAALAANVARPAPSVTVARPTIPAPLATLIMRCLEKHPADRWQSADELVRRLEAMTTPGDGTVPTVPVPAARAARRRWPLLAGMGAAAALAFWAVVLRRPAASPTLEANLLAVAPFDVLGGELEIWREGLVDVLSRNLDGAGPLRTVSPTVVIRRWVGRADPVSASALGRRTGAGLTVFGNVVAAGQDSVRLTATIQDVARDRTIGEVQLRGDTRYMDRVVDSLTVSLLRELGRTRDILAVRTASVRATSLPALKAFLEGERLYRRGAWDSAQGAYRRALFHDSTFVPALRHLGQTLGWRGEREANIGMYFLRAGELNHGLPRRDSLLVTAESLGAALLLGVDLPAALRRSLRRREFTTLEEATRLYPDDPEIWYMLGETRFHRGWEERVSPSQTLDAFDRSIALDSNFTPAYVHATTLGLTLHGLDGWNRYVRPYLVLHPSEELLGVTRFLDTIFKAQQAHPADADSIIRSASPDRLLLAMWDSWHFPDSSETAVRLARALVAHRSEPAGDPRLSASGRRQMLAGALAYRGHLREALALIEGERVEWIASVPAGIAILGSSRPESVDATFGRWLRHGRFWLPPGNWPPGRLLYALPWWSARQATAALSTFASRADSVRRVTSRPILKEAAQYAQDAARAYSILAGGDSAGALRLFEALPRDVGYYPMEWVTMGQVLARQGHDANALEILEGAFPLPGGNDSRSPIRTLAKLEAARAAERLGQVERAAAYYQFVVDVWRHADAELEPYVGEARAGLERLAAER